MTTQLTSAMLYRAADIKDEISSLESELQTLFRAKPIPPRRDGWTPERRARFNQTIRQRQKKAAK